MRHVLCTIACGFPRGILVLVAVLCLSGAAWAQPVELQPGQHVTQLDHALTYWAAIGPYPDPAYRALQDGLFSTEPVRASPGFAHAPERWFAVEVKNNTLAGGGEGDAFVVLYDAVSVMGYRLFLVREDGVAERLVNYSAWYAFSPDQWAANRLRSPEFALAPGEQVTLLAHLQLGVAPLASVSILHADALPPQSAGWAASLVGFYAFAISCVLLGLGFLVAMRSFYGLVYLGLLAALLWMLAYLDLLVFRFLVPSNPALYAALGNVPLFLMGAVIAYVASVGFRRGALDRPILSRVLLGLAVLSLLLMGLMLVLPSAVFLWVGLGLVAVSLGVSIFMPPAIYQREDNPGNGLRLLLAVITLTTFASLAWSLFGSGASGISVRLPIKMSFTVLLLSVVTFFTVNLTALRRRHMRAVEARVAALEREAERSRQLLEAERAYRRASESAALHQRKLATASHDIQQPLMSLRTTFDAISADMDASVTERLREAFSYLETLSKSYVDGTVPTESPAPEDVGTEPEVYALSVPLGTVEQMFSSEAASKGLSLRVLPTTLETTVRPMVLMRIVTNLVSNAIKYTSAGGVLVGMRRAGPTIWVCDTGCGMSEAQIAEMVQPYSKGEMSGGHGLGLSVCAELAAANDIGFTVASVPGRGTVFQVSLDQYRP